MFKPAFIPPAEVSRSSLWFIFENGRLLTKNDARHVRIPTTRDLENWGLTPSGPLFLGSLGDRPCYAEERTLEGPARADMRVCDLRALFGELPETFIWVAGRANQLLDWQRTHRFCGRCGHPTCDKTDERAKVCPACRLINYPRLSPAVIVAVLKDDRLLLARNRRFRLPFFSVLAGFVEPGESLEECVAREIAEEVGINVKNIRYFGSQPWPFPNSLMVAFTADYDSGRITVDDAEIVEADWFARDALPPIPPKISIARQLIDWFVARPAHGGAHGSR